MAGGVNYRPIYRWGEMRFSDVAYPMVGYFPCGFAFMQGGDFLWHPKDDCPEMVQIGDWIAANENKFFKSYRTTRAWGGFIVVFETFYDVIPLKKWLKNKTEIDSAAAYLGRNRKRNKKQQLPGSADRAWSSELSLAELKPLRFQIPTPVPVINPRLFADFPSDLGNIYVPIRELKDCTLKTL